MAPPPRNRSVDVDLPDDSAAPSEWFGAVLQQLNQFMNDTQFALDKGLTSANMSQWTYQLDFTTGATVAASFPIRVTAQIPTPVEHVQVLQKQVVGAGSFAGATDASHWALLPGNVVQINEITGLNPATHYRITLRFT